MKSQNGIAFVSAVILSFVAMSFIAALMYIITQSVQISGTTKKYVSSLEVAKGIADYIIAHVRQEPVALTCNNLPCSTTNNNIDIVGVVLPDYIVTAKFLGESSGLNSIIYAFRIEVSRKGSTDKAVIEFIYKKEL
ncbi:hypothetical protein [Hydrogenivirga sp. 128-5-R1-1]|uniref:hypothetical protein n=1 Tax=Hydrogenivirga sp. 128-5-R1-1 TaxID=392423 RepID=UPI00015F300D|nr:hypothetical protein [Hydrogenivirga sp. 128-5-R1-1]EDP74487.1 hypothetical protein HG1285_09971 [Hydrogenivirga sp. 128-5-R1-1]